MTTLISADEFKERFDISDDIDDKRIKPHIGSASRRLRRWVGDALYQLAISGAEADADLQEDLKNAEAHLTFHFAITGLNYPLTTKGIVATAMSNEGKEMRKYLTPDETAKVERQFLEKAREIVDPYLTDTYSTVEVALDGEC